MSTGAAVIVAAVVEARGKAGEAGEGRRTTRTLMRTMMTVRADVGLDAAGVTTVDGLASRGTTTTMFIMRVGAEAVGSLDIEDEAGALPRDSIAAAAHGPVAGSRRTGDTIGKFQRPLRVCRVW